MSYTSFTLNGIASLILISLIFPESSQTSRKERERTVTVTSFHSDESPASQNYEYLDLPLSAKDLSPIVLYEIGESLLMKGNPVEAIPYLGRAAELLTRDSFAQGNYAIALHQVALHHLRIAQPQSYSFIQSQSPNIDDLRNLVIEITLTRAYLPSSRPVAPRWPWITSAGQRR